MTTRAFAPSATGAGRRSGKSLAAQQADAFGDLGLDPVAVAGTEVAVDVGPLAQRDIRQVRVADDLGRRRHDVFDARQDAGLERRLQDAQARAARKERSVRPERARDGGRERPARRGHPRLRIRELGDGGLVLLRRERGLRPLMDRGQLIGEKVRVQHIAHATKHAHYTSVSRSGGATCASQPG